MGVINLSACVFFQLFDQLNESYQTRYERCAAGAHPN
jgi:hypothetical protein